MSDRLSLILAGLIVLSLALDLTLLQGAATMFLAVKLSDLVEYLSFWR